MNVATYFKWSLHFDEHRLAHEYVFNGSYDSQDHGLLEFDKFSGLAVSNLEKSLNGCVNIDVNFLGHF